MHTQFGRSALGFRFSSEHKGKTMKKVLFATTALIATAGIASAEVALSGSAEMGIVGGDRYGDQTQFWTHVDVTFTLSGETDGGISFGASVDLDEAGDAIDGDDGTDGVAVFISGDFGTLTMGDTDGAYDFAMIEINRNGAGSIDDTETAHAGFDGNSGLDGDYDGQILRYDYSFDSFSFAVSVELDDGSDETIYAVGATYNYGFAGGSVLIGAGYQEDSGSGATVAGISASVALDSGLTATVNYAEGDMDNGGLDETYVGLGVAYTFDDITVSANYGMREEDVSGDEDTGFAIAAQYDLGGGLSAHAAYNMSDDGGANTPTSPDNSFTVGLAMSF